MKATIKFTEAEVSALVLAHINDQLPAPAGHKWQVIPNYGSFTVELFPIPQPSTIPNPPIDPMELHTLAPARSL